MNKNLVTALMRPDPIPDLLVGAVRRRGERDDDEPWRHRARCRGVGSEVFFDHARITEAETVCASCPVRDECAQYAEANAITCGVWGGRSREARARARAAAEV